MRESLLLSLGKRIHSLLTIFLKDSCWFGSGTASVPFFLLPFSSLYLSFFFSFLFRKKNIQKDKSKLQRIVYKKEAPCFVNFLHCKPYHFILWKYLEKKVKYICVISALRPRPGLPFFRKIIFMRGFQYLWIFSVHSVFLTLLHYIPFFSFG